MGAQFDPTFHDQLSSSDPIPPSTSSPVNIHVNEQLFPVEKSPKPQSVNILRQERPGKVPEHFISGCVEGVKALNLGMGGSSLLADFEIPDFVSQQVDQKDYTQAKELITHKNSTEFKNLLANLKHDEAGELVKRLLNDEVDLLKEGSKENYHFILKNIIEVFPDISTYFSEPEPNKYTLTSKGIDLIVADLRKREKIRCDVNTCFMDAKNRHHPDSIETKLGAFLKSGQKEAFFIVRHGFEAGHHTPLYIQKHNDGYRILMTDSTGGETYYGVYLQNTLEEILQNNHIDAKIYTHIGEARQYDSTNCAIFAIRDVVQVAKNPDAIFEWIEKNGESIEASSTSLLFKHLPPQMMKTMQHLDPIKKRTALPGYLKNNPAVTVSTRGQEIPLSEYIEKNKIRKGDLALNFKVPGLFLKYQRQVLAEVIGNATQNSA